MEDLDIGNDFAPEESDDDNQGDASIVLHVVAEKRYCSRGLCYSMVHQSHCTEVWGAADTYLEK